MGGQTANAASFPTVAALLVGALLAGCGATTGVDVTHQAVGRASKRVPCTRATAVPDHPESNCGDHNEPQAKATRSRIAFARCMRMHGVRNFPYPTARGRVSVEMVKASGINPQSPRVARAGGECLPPWLRPPKAH
jgi:hypothetical protein